MPHPHPGRPWLALAPVALALAIILLLSSCGGGSPKPAAAATTATTTTPAGGSAGASGAGGAGAGGGARGVSRAALQAFRSCMQQHGVNLPTPPSQPPTTDTSAGAPGGAGADRPRGAFGGLGALLDSSDPTTQAAFKACEGQLPAGFAQRLQTGVTAFQAYASCMQSHGVTVSRAGRMFGSTTTTTPQFAGANDICKALLPARGPGGPPASAGQ